MGYEKRSIEKITDEITKRKIYIPAIQRKFVWKDDQIYRLLDSIMQGYPIGTFLFWKVKKKIINDKEYSMYDFIKDYHERDLFKNPLAALPFPSYSDDETVWALLDGQQRLTSLYIALQGSMKRKLPSKRWKNDDAFPKKELYFNLLSQPNTNNEIKYEFKFLTEKEVRKSKDNKLWYLVKNIFNYKTTEILPKILIPNNWSDEIISTNLSILFNHFKEIENINYYEVEGDSIDNVLDIFVRVNSGGTVLSKSDLLFSTIISHWDKGRDKIDDLLTEINNIGEGFKFSNDFIMRTCLYLLDLSITLKVETFKKNSIIEIKNNWGSIYTAIKETVLLLNEFGFNYKNLISYVSVIPIVYYKFKGGTFNKKSKYELKKYIIIVQLKQIFGAATNNALSTIREAQKRNNASNFDLNYFKNLKFTGERTLKYTESEIEDLFDTHEKNAYTFMILSLLYPNLKYSQKRFHQDHIHPYSAFEDDNINELQMQNSTIISQEKIIEWQRKRNTLANLQLLEGKENESKNAKSLIEWLKEDNNKNNVKYMPLNISYELNNFEEFLTERQKLMSLELKKILL